MGGGDYTGGAMVASGFEVTNLATNLPTCVKHTVAGGCVVAHSTVKQKSLF